MQLRWPFGMIIGFYKAILWAVFINFINAICWHIFNALWRCFEREVRKSRCWWILHHSKIRCSEIASEFLGEVLYPESVLSPEKIIFVLGWLEFLWYPYIMPGLAFIFVVTIGLPQKFEMRVNVFSAAKARVHDHLFFQCSSMVEMQDLLQDHGHS